MFEEYQICPYTGLRSFTEEESLYFKGREEHIEQATEQLQRNKFLMLTGASGDGKSSLVYAGIVPNARAGFLKSKYTQWGVADFRPERTPFKNLCKAVARQLHISNPQTVESELHHGFSALVDLYKNSVCYVDVDSVAWRQANDSERAALKRSAANLIIIVDQFEEFFTNPENYHHGVPSRDSSLVLNLLLETSRIALEEDLPIYIVFTMRSDYIGQCAAFRSLPEYIGFSQFFVPRLNRTQLQQVIEEPATLSGNRISRRLTERLIHDISEGVDQLPILQHALNQIWHAADQGREEMDLIHYAIVGGMPSAELPDDQVSRFTNWFQHLPEKIKKCYHEPNLQNVLDTHANKLFESSAESYRNKTGKELPEEVAKTIVKTTFTCLTKIDQSRAVRNRMTLKEIQEILNRRDVDIETIGWVLNIFRESGNTFIRPFITDDPESAKLTENSVLDITHESLIRNWELLEQWAKEEFDNYTVSLDFEQQLSRWVESGKSDSFLLSMGPLTYFENWYNKVQPNAHWIARYLPEDIAQKKKLSKAKQVLANAQEFLKRSARKHVVTRAIVKYGPRRIAAVFAILGVLVLSSFGVRNYLRQQNANVLRNVTKESVLLAGNRKVALEEKSILLAENVRLGLITIPEIAKGIDDPIERVNAIAGMATAMVAQGWHEPEKEIYESLTVADSLLQLFPVSLSTSKYTEVLREINEFMVTLNFAYHFNPTERMDKLVKRNARRTADWLLLIAREKPGTFEDIKNFDMAIEHAINNTSLSSEEISELIQALSPLEGKGQHEWIQKNFSRDKISERGNFNYGFAFNGLYQELAYLYAAHGNAAKALQCVDTLMKYNQKYFLNDYSTMPDHAAHIAATFYKYNKQAQMDEFVDVYCQRKKIDQAGFYRIFVALNSIHRWGFLRLNYFPDWNRFTNFILLLADNSQLTFFHQKYRKTIVSDTKKNDERNFYLALSYKDQAVHSHVLSIHERTKEPALTNAWFDSAFYFYNQVGQEFLEQKVPMYNNSESRPLKFLFLYPDFNTPFFPGEPRGGYFYFLSTRFLDYIIEHNLFDTVFPTETELVYVDEWLAEGRPVLVNNGLWTVSGFKINSLLRLEEKIRSRKTSTQSFDDLYLRLGHEMAKQNLDSGLYFYKQLNLAKVANITGGNGNYGMLFVARAITHLARASQMEEAYKFVQLFKKPVNRASLYGFAAQQLMLQKINTPVVDQLIDSARAEMLRVENTGVDQPSRLHVPFALALRSQPKDIEEADRIIKNVAFKFFVQQRLVQAIGFNNNLYEAYDRIAPTISSPDKATMLWNLLYGYAESKNADSTDKWKLYETNQRWWYTRAINYEDENN